MGAPDFPAPRFGTERNLQRETAGGKVALVAKALHRPQMPWQRYVSDIVNEIDPATGHPWYRTVILCVTRQEGKTTLVMDNGITTAVTHPDDFLVYTAQNRIKALARLERAWYPPIRRHLPGMLEPFRGSRKPGWVGKSGNEHLLFANGARLAIDAVKKDSGHGDTALRAYIDEAFSHKDASIEQSFRPTMLTRADAQIWITSAAGTTVDSTYMWEKVKLGRALIMEAIASTRIAYFEWSNDDGDRADPATWATCLPAIGHTVTIETIKAEFDSMVNDPDDFDRAYLGRWPGIARKDPEIPIAAWRNCVMPEGFKDYPIDYAAAPPVYVVDTSPDRAWTSVSITGKSSDPFAEVCSRLAAYENGTAWVVEFMDQLRDAAGGSVIYIAGDGAAASLQPDLEQRGWTVVLLSSPEICNACGAHYDAVLRGAFRHIDERNINAALAAAVKRNVGDRWRWYRGKSLGDISALYAVALGYWAFLLRSSQTYDIAKSIN